MPHQDILSATQHLGVDVSVHADASASTKVDHDIVALALEMGWGGWLPLERARLPERS